MNMSFIVLILKQINTINFHVNNFLLFRLFGSQDVFSDKRFTVAYHGTEPLFFLFFSLFYVFLCFHARPVVLQRATTLRLDALSLNQQAVISIFDVSFSELKPVLRTSDCFLAVVMLSLSCCLHCLPVCVSDAVWPKFEVVIKAPRMVHQQDVLHGSVCAK